MGAQISQESRSRSGHDENHKRRRRSKSGRGSDHDKLGGRRTNSPEGGDPGGQPSMGEHTQASRGPVLHRCHLCGEWLPSHRHSHSVATADAGAQWRPVGKTSEQSLDQRAGKSSEDTSTLRHGSHQRWHHYLRRVHGQPLSRHLRRHRCGKGPYRMERTWKSSKNTPPKLGQF